MKSYFDEPKVVIVSFILFILLFAGLIFVVADKSDKSIFQDIGEKVRYAQEEFRRGYESADTTKIDSTQKHRTGQ